MKIYIAPCREKKLRRKTLQELAEIAKPQIHTLVESPEAADIILVADTKFTDPFLRQFCAKYLDKCYAIDLSDKPSFSLPGLYASAKTVLPFHQCRIRGCSYIFNLNGGGYRNEFLDDDSDDTNVEKQYLFSFVGASTSWVRKRLFKMKFQRDRIFIQCTNEYDHWNVRQLNREAMQKSYVDIIRRSKFVLCPRGVGRGTIRLFEAMKLGVAPIVISDKWLPPVGTDWHSFAIFVKQSELENIFEIAERYASEYEERGRLAKKAWEEYFADSVVFNQAIEAIADLKQNRIPLLDRVIFASDPFISMSNNSTTLIRGWLKSLILGVLSILKLNLPYKLRFNANNKSSNS